MTDKLKELLNELSEEEYKLLIKFSKIFIETLKTADEMDYFGKPLY